MGLKTDYAKNIIAKMGFTPQNGKNNVYFKAYPLHNGYVICVDFDAEKIEYYTQDTPTEARISLGDGTTSNFSHAENFVVLECIDRLLEKGYSPSCIELEKTYPSGRGHSGRLDILVSTPEGVPYLMVECKTWGTEYEKEYKKMLKDGGQLFTYYANDRATKYLCLYTSRLNKEIEYKNAIINANDSWRELSGTKDIFTHWNKNFRDNGIFETHAAPYDIKHKALTYGMLKNLKEEDSGKIYNQIMEILRHNAISDKPNAFNKLLNLFVCKIIDENKNEDDELRFQWLETDTNESLQMRLNDLYMEGMWRFLEIKVIDYEEKEVSEKLENIDNDDVKKWVMQMYQDTRLKKSPNFAFVEVQDEKTFQHNAKVVREIVELLQVYRFRYEQKHEFLGNFFELLLNTSMKQEAGQFFTPAPITRFIISSLPLREFVQKKVDDRKEDTLPTVIDYACGSGHFLTEYMSQLQRVINSKINTDKTSPTIRSQFQSWQGPTNFLWAKDYVYGIDFDNRLVKTTKVSAFFNGDGEAAVIWANGLDSFSKSEEYRGKLRNSTGPRNQDNGQFDILISNPPYSVDAFKSTLQYGEESFELYKYVTDNSSEIECLFVERMKQLLKVGGWAGIILPSSLLSNGGIYSKTREIIFKYFKVKSIVELGSGTFMETGTNTIILFLERRNDNDHVAIAKAVNTFFVNKGDVTVTGIENAFSKYVTSAYDDLSFEDYVALITGSANEKVQKHELYVNYKKAFGDDFYTKLVEIEKEKMFYFLLTYEQEIVLVKTGKGKDEKQFLGYEFSKRRGHEGIKWLPSGTKLYDNEGILLNPTKANSYIYRSFLGEKIDIDESLAHNISYGRMSSFIEYGTNKFDKIVNLGKRKKMLQSKYPLIPIGSICELKYGRALKELDRQMGEYPVYGSNGIVGTHNESITESPVIVIGRKGSAGKVTYSETACYPIDTTFYIDHVKQEVLLEYLYFSLRMLDLEGLTKQMGVPGLNRDNVYAQKIPVPPIKIQQKIVAKMKEIEEDKASDVERINQLNAKISSIINSQSRYPYLVLDSLAHINTTNIQPLDTPRKKFIYVDIDAIENGTGKIDFSKHVVGKMAPSRARRLAKSDSTIISTVRPNLKAFAFVEKEIPDCIYSTGFAILESVNENILLNKWIYYNFMYSNDLMEQMIAAMPRAQYPSINNEDIKGFRIFVPPVAVQQELLMEIQLYEADITKFKERIVKLELSKDEVLKKHL